MKIQNLDIFSPRRWPRLHFKRGLNFEIVIQKLQNLKVDKFSARVTVRNLSRLQIKTSFKNCIYVLLPALPDEIQIFAISPSEESASHHLQTQVLHKTFIWNWKILKNVIFWRLFDIYWWQPPIFALCPSRGECFAPSFGKDMHHFQSAHTKKYLMGGGNYL